MSCYWYFSWLNAFSSVKRRNSSVFDITWTVYTKWNILRERDKTTVKLNYIPANTQRNKRVIITSKQRLDVIITCLLRCVFAAITIRYGDSNKIISPTNRVLIKVIILHLYLQCPGLVMSTKDESSRHGEDNDAMETQAEENSNNFSPEEEILLDIVREYINSLPPERCGSNSLQRRHNGHDGVSNHQPYHCLLNRLFSADKRKHESPASLAFV